MGNPRKAGVSVASPTFDNLTVTGPTGIAPVPWLQQFEDASPLSRALADGMARGILEGCDRVACKGLAQLALREEHPQMDTGIYIITSTFTFLDGDGLSHPIALANWLGDANRMAETLAKANARNVRKGAPAECLQVWQPGVGFAMSTFLDGKRVI